MKQVPELTMDSELSRLTVRHARSTDLPAMEWDGELTHYRRLFAEVFKYTQQGLGLMWVAELPTVGIIAQLFVHLNSQRLELADGAERAYIYGFRVKAAYRSRGLGTLMMTLVEEDLVSRGFTWVALNVGRDNPDALRLYERLGYEVIGPDPGRWSYLDDKGVMQTVHEPAWRMQKRLETSPRKTG
jgi:ribosomal protein S18 acetylase RimI-like enzyme